ncbi:MAG: tetratricopeptide repeat protein [Pseudomonadota bacterium]
MEKTKTLSRLARLVAIAALPVSVVLMGAGPASAQGIAGPYLAAKQAEARGDVGAAARLYSETLARDPENAEVLERAMINQIAAGKVAEGIALARRLQAFQPDHHLGVLALAADGLKKNDMEAVREALGENPPFVGQIIDAWAAQAAEGPETSTALLSALEASENNGVPGQVIAAYHLGLVLAATGDDAGGAAALGRAATLANGGTRRLARLRAGALARLGQTDEAIKVINDRLAGTYGDPALSEFAEGIKNGAKPDLMIRNAREGAAEVLFGVSGFLASGRNRLIALSYSRLATYLSPDLTEAQLLIAQILDQDGLYDLAVAAYQAVPDDAPQAMSAWIGRAEAKQAAGRIDDAVTDMRAATERFPDALEVHTALGSMLRRESRFEEASSAYDAAIALLPEIEPHHWGLFYQRGITFERSKQWDRAESDFRKALELEPDQPDVLNYLGYSLVELGQKLEEAEKMIELAVEQRPDDGYIVDSLGWVLFRFAEFERAVEHLERAVELRPVDPVINDHFGDALWMVGRRTEARFQWKRALSFEPEEKDAKRIRRKLDEGLDVILEEEKAEGLPGIIGRTEGDKEDDGKTNDGG